MDLMEIDDDIYINKNLTMDTPSTTGDFQRRKQPSRCVTACLVLLVLVLLAGNVGQMIYYEIITGHSLAKPMQASYDTLTQETEHLKNQSDTLTAERDQLQSNYDSLTAERKQLEASLRNLAKEKDQMQQNFNSLSAERDEFKASFDNLKNVRDRLQANYNTLKQQSDELRTSYNDTQRNLKGLQTKHNNLTATKDQLQAKYNNQQREKDELQNRFWTVIANRDQLQSNYSSLKRDMDQLQRRYDALSTSKNGLDTSYNSLWREKAQLQTRYNSLWRANNWLQTNYSSLLTDRDKLQNGTDKLMAKLRGFPCKTGWKKFEISCYFFSTMKKNWTESRKSCMAQGADLVVIESREEQVFINRGLKTGQNAWIGLSDHLTEGVWLWVDGTPATTQYWQPGQPNSFNGNQDCVEIVQKTSDPVGQWNDDGCYSEQIWICEQ